MLAIYEFAHAVDTTHLQNAVAHRRFEQNSEIAPRRDMQDHLADRDTEDFLRLGVKRQALKLFTRDRLVQVNDELELHFSARRRFTEDGSDVQQPKPAHLQIVAQHARAAAFNRRRRDPRQLDHIIPDKTMPARDEFERRFIQKCLERSGGDVSRAAIALDMHRQSLQQKLKDLGVARGGDDS